MRCHRLILDRFAKRVNRGFHGRGLGGTGCRWRFHCQAPQENWRLDIPDEREAGQFEAERDNGITRRREDAKVLWHENGNRWRANDER